MKRRFALLALLAATGCSWSNSLYLARRYSKEAVKVEREGRPFEAQTLWGQVLTKADTAWTRSGGTRFEALGYVGIAQARMGDCMLAIPSLEAASERTGWEGWGLATHFELGRCRQRLGLPEVEAELRPVLDGPDAGFRLESARTLATLYLVDRRWPELRTLAPEMDHTELRFARAVATIADGDELAGRSALAPLLAARDTTVLWSRLIEELARTRARWTDALLDSLDTTPRLTDERRGEWLLAAIRGALLAGDTLAARDRLTRLGRLPASQALDQARRLDAEDRMARVGSLDELATVIGALPPTGTEDAGPNSRVLQLRRTAWVMTTERDSITGVPQGDLRLLAQALDAEQVLRAPQLVRALYLRLEREWPRSPYLIKGMAARILAEPDSADAVRSRLQNHAGNPYLAILLGQDDDRYRVLDDSLGSFVTTRQARIFSAPVGSEVVRE